MRPPSLRLTNRGNGPETITVYAIDWSPDEEGNSIKTPSIGATYPAIVAPQSATLEDGNIVASTTAYSVMVITPDDPGIMVETDVVWTPGNLPQRILRANGQCSRRGPGAWVFSAMEVDPNSSGTDGPVGEQTTP